MLVRSQCCSSARISIIGKINARKTGTYATFRAGNYGPTFGGGHDLYIADNANMCTSSYSNLGHTYAIPPGQGTTGSVKAQTFLAGTYNFTPVELEVYSISDKL